MNNVPVIFLEGVVSQLFNKKLLLAGSALSGRLGHVASEAYAKRRRQYIRLTNGWWKKDIYFNCEDQELDIGTLSRKHLHHITIAIGAHKNAYSTDPEAMERVLSVTKGQHVILSLQTPNISEEIAKCVESIRLVFELRLYTKITSDVLKMLRLLVEKNTLNKMKIGKDVKIKHETEQLLVDLLKQNQFYKMSLRGKCSAALKEIFTSWRENSEEMVGKIISCKEGFSEFQLSPTEFPFEECTEEEERDAKYGYYIVSHWPNITVKSVLRNQDGNAVYCLSRSAGVYNRTLFVFA